MRQHRPPAAIGGYVRQAVFGLGSSLCCSALGGCRLQALNVRGAQSKARDGPRVLEGRALSRVDQRDAIENSYSIRAEGREFRGRTRPETEAAIFASKAEKDPQNRTKALTSNANGVERS